MTTSERRHLEQIARDAEITRALDEWVYELQHAEPFDGLHRLLVEAQLHLSTRSASLSRSLAVMLSY